MNFEKLKKVLFGLLICSSAVIVSSCENELNPNGEYRESYAVNCLLRCDSTTQYVTLTKSYLPDESNPYSYTTDPFVHGADVKIYNGSEFIQFRDTTFEYFDLVRYMTKKSVYYAKNFHPENNTNYEINVQIPNGRKLKGATTSPLTVEFIKLTSSLLINEAKELYSYYWKTSDNNTVYVPRLTFTYYKTVNGVKTKGIKSIPVRYEIVKGVDKPIYPQPDKKPYIHFDGAALKKAFDEISANDPNKWNYSIVSSTRFELLVLDMNLSAYYSTSNSSYGEFSVKLDESDYSNITNGFGIFGSYLQQGISVSFSEEFINSFGYALVYN